MVDRTQAYLFGILDGEITGADNTYVARLKKFLFLTLLPHVDRGRVMHSPV